MSRRGPTSWRRRTLLTATAASAAAGALSGCERRARGRHAEIPCRFVGQDPQRGHRLRRGPRPSGPPEGTIDCEVLIVGAGVAGLAAAWTLRRFGVDFRVVELEAGLGGTASQGRFDRSDYPLGAHYLPAPGPELGALTALLDELGLVAGRDALGQAEWRSDALLAAPLERHFFRGRWFPGLFPGWEASEDDFDQWERWSDHLRELDARRAPDGGRLFRLPARRSAPQLQQLDRQSMASYLDGLGISSWRVRWMVDYACRDDYGCRLEDTSAFAGLHHFLCRGLEETTERDILTFPEGNGALSRGMARNIGLLEADAPLALDSAVVELDPLRGEAEVLGMTDGLRTRYRAERILWAAPRFVLPHVLTAAHRGLDPFAGREPPWSYAPWLVANLDLDRAPGGYGAPLSWDNVPTEDDNLGYVVATHGRDTTHTDAGAVISFYQPFTGDPAQARRELLEGDARHWRDRVMGALLRVHPSLEAHVRAVTIARWGHAMIRPTPGTLFGTEALDAAAPIGRVIPCASDCGGLALFEEAFYAGHHAALTALEDRREG